MPHIKIKFCSTNYYSLKLLLQPFKFTNKIIHCAIVTHQYSTFKDIQKHYCNHAHITGFCQSQPVSSKNFCIIFTNEFAPDRPSHLFLKLTQRNEVQCQIYI